MAEQKTGRNMKNKMRTVTFAMTAFLLAAGIGSLQVKADTTQNTKTGGAGNTTEVKLAVARELKQVSFEVPLYYTAVITNDNSGVGSANKIYYPSGYALRNANEKEPLVVTAVETSGVNGSTWKIVDSLTDTTGTDKEMVITIGGLPLPAITDGETTLQKDRKRFTAKMTDYTSKFYDLDNRRYIPLGENGQDGKTVLDVTMDIPTGYTVTQGSDDSTVAQFRVFYTVAPLDNSGKPIGVYNYTQKWVDDHYEGPRK